MKFKKIIFTMFSLLIVSFSCFSSSIASSNAYIWSGNSSGLLETAVDSETDLKLQAGGAILIEQSTGTVLYEHNSHEKFRPASVTKVMSLLLIMEAIDSRRIKIHW